MFTKFIKRFISLSLLVSFLISNNFLIVSAKEQDYKFTGKIEAKVIYTDYSPGPVSPSTKQTVQLEVTKAKKDGSYPVGTLLSGEVTGYKNRKRLSRDAKLTVNLKSALLPDGRNISINRSIEIKPTDKLRYYRQVGNLSFLGAGIALGITVSLVTLGLPVARGGLAVWNAGHEVYESPKGASKAKAATFGFFKGGLYPLVDIVAKGDEINVHKGSVIYIGKEKSKKKHIKAYLIKKYN